MADFSSFASRDTTIPPLLPRRHLNRKGLFYVRWRHLRRGRICVQHRRQVIQHPHHFDLRDVLPEGVALLLYGDEYGFTALDVGGEGFGEDLVDYMVALLVLIFRGSRQGGRCRLQIAPSLRSFLLPWWAIGRAYPKLRGTDTTSDIVSIGPTTTMSIGIRSSYCLNVYDNPHRIDRHRGNDGSCYLD